MQLTVTKMTYGPDGIARTPEGKAVFVSGAIAGDTVEVEITSDGKSHMKACTTEVIEPSPNRIKPLCDPALLTSGTPWACMTYDAQLTAKRQNIIDSLERIGHFDPEHVAKIVEPIVPSDSEWGYRNKIELVAEKQGKQTAIGMHSAASNKLVTPDAGILLPKKFSKLPKQISGALKYMSGSRDLRLERLGIRVSERTEDVEVALWTSTGEFPRAQVARVINESSKTTSVVRVLLKDKGKARKVSGVESLSGNGSWTEKIDNHVMRLSAPSFFQVNTKGADKLVSIVMEKLDPQISDYAVDLFCGAGTFTLPLARRCSEVAGVESYGSSVRDLRRNLENEHITNCEVIGGDAAREVAELDDADIFIVDPPRAGLDQSIIEVLSNSSARAIAYVSCDPATLARDLARFEEIGKFSPTSITPVDLFPQTFHVECVTLMSRVEK